MKNKFLSPAQYVLRVFGGVRPAARAIGRSPSSISVWTKPRKTRGMTGTVPARAQRKILQLAKLQSLDINANDLTVGRTITLNGR